MLNTNTSVLTRRVWIDGDYATLAYEAGWAAEAVFFAQVEGEHPSLTLGVEVSPDGINWIQRGATTVLASFESIAELPVSTFGNWLRITVSGASVDQRARLLVHLNLKG